MHPTLYSWREQLPAAVVRMLAYLGGLALLSIAAAQVFQSRPAIDAIKPVDRGQWNEIARPFPAFALSIPEAAGVPAHYAVRYSRNGAGRKDVLSLGEPNTPAPYLRIEIYRPGGEIARFAEPVAVIATAAQDLKPDHLQREEPLDSKFGPLSIVTFDTRHNAHCLGFVRSFDDPRLQLSGWFCRGGALIQRSTLSCALDRLTLLSAGSEPKIGALFAGAQLKRGFCGEHDPLIAATPKYKLLWKALESRRTPRRIGR
jgi:hypothetical protein